MYRYVYGNTPPYDKNKYKEILEEKVYDFGNCNSVTQNKITISFKLKLIKNKMEPKHMKRIK